MVTVEGQEEITRIESDILVEKARILDFETRLKDEGISSEEQDRFQDTIAIASARIRQLDLAGNRIRSGTDPRYARMYAEEKAEQTQQIVFDPDYLSPAQRRRTETEQRKTII